MGTSVTNSSSTPSREKRRTVVVPIDLPGQPVQCWFGDAEKIKVILRKPRDVIFDIKLCNGKSYSVTSSYGDMYEVRTKKLIHPKEIVFFKDGETLHLQIARDFKGKILLYEDGSKISEYDIPKLDPEEVNADPQFKPAPISIIIKNDLIFGNRDYFNVIQLDGTFSSPKISDQEAESFIQIVEISESGKDIPQEVADFFKKGGEKEVFASASVVTRNWIMNQIIAQSGYASDNQDWMKELWREKITLKSIVHKNVGTKYYAILTGSTRARRLISASRYSTSNTKVLAFSFGAKEASGLRHSGWSAAKGNFRRGGLASMLFTITLDIAEWSADYEQRDPVTGKPKQDISDLFIKIGIDIAKNTINTVITSCLMWGVLTAVGGAPIIVIIIGTVVFSILVGWAIDYFDKKYGGTEKLVEAIQTAPKKLEEKLQRDYDGYVKAIGHALFNGGLHDGF